MRAAHEPLAGPHDPRPDANRIALRVARSILEAASPLEIVLEGTLARVTARRLPSPAWPALAPGGLAPGGLTEEVDGPWPGAVELACAWPNGRASLLMAAALGRGGSAPHQRIVGLRVVAPATDQRLVWVRIAPTIDGRGDGARVSVSAPFGMPGRREGEAPHDGRDRERAAALKVAAHRSGLPLAGDRRVEVFAVRLPEGEVLPLPNDAFTRVVHLALLKLPFAAEIRPDLVEGEPPFAIGALAASPLPRSYAERARLARMSPLPGGVRHYKATLDALLAWIGQAQPPVLHFRETLSRQYDASGRAAADTYLRFLESTRLVERRGDVLELTEAGAEYGKNPAAERLFERLHASHAGLLETLVLTGTPGIEGPAHQKRLLEGLLSRQWKTLSQLSFRRNWLLSLGLVERTEEGDLLTPLGRRVLRAHAAEASEIRKRIEDLFEADLEAELVKADDAADAAGASEEEVEEKDEEGGGESAALKPAGDLAAPGGGPPRRWSEPLKLTADSLRPHLNRLRVPDAVLHRISAALTSGKHLLLVGPPGTGKTDLALALGEAARAEGYCEGVLSATASADWTTFDTIGGYALQKDGAFRFRPGVFLSALERWQWLLIDELNRADVDRAFGELLTVLAGRGASAPFSLEDGRLVSIGPDTGSTHRLPRSFRLLATMNTWDKTSLFRLSYAVQRRFAIIHIDAPDDAGFDRLLDQYARDDEGTSPSIEPRALASLKRLFSASGLLAHRALGPAIAVDMMRYLRCRGAAGDGFAEAIAMVLLPQLEGLTPGAAAKVVDVFRATLTGWASAEAIAELYSRCREMFPGVRLPDP